MTHPLSVEVLGAVLVRQLMEYGVCSFRIQGEDEGVHLIEPWRVLIDGKPIPLPPHALLDVLSEEEAIRRMLSSGMSEVEVARALEERDRRTRALELREAPHGSGR
jgi:hypothetical protein